MKYKFIYETKAFDLWKLSIYGVYGSMVGVFNIIFTVAMVLLTAKFWGEVNIFIKILLIIAVSLFTVIQPVAVYMRAKRHIATVPHDMEIGFDDNGIYIKTKNENSELKWNTIKGVLKKQNMIVIFTTTKHGLMITNQMLGTEKEGFYKYVVSQVKK
ncbi:MAG: YcxB family protein [Sedimentibacter sp.]|uniref:YcxB family protein n=1 Tax=Sedimentibacter sp. TaxID=1960295 RepID=UPI0029813168|nr:YcxB family protein [Sedimentibacter sp.]MDW5299359.1 YcxB family protein [Sedimentibacter sp.]